MSETLKENVTVVVQELYNHHGEVKASALVAKAKSPSSPAHRAFEWNNKKAGHQYRLIQARHWLTRVEILVEETPTRLVHVPLVCISAENEQEASYKPIILVLKNRHELELAVGELRRYIDGAQSRLDVLLGLRNQKRLLKKLDVKKFQRGLKAAREAILV